MNPFKSKLLSSWAKTPPNIQFMTQPMPNTPHLHLSGSGIARISPEKFIKELERDLRGQTGRYYAYVKGGEREEADTFILEGWVVYTSPDCVHEATVILYYSALNPYETIKKWMNESMAEEYRCKQLAILN